MSEDFQIGVRHLTVKDDDEGQRLDRWLKKNVPELPYVLAQKLMRKGQMRVDGKRAKPDTKLKGGQDVRIPPIKPAAPRKEQKLSDKDIAFVKSLVLYEDEYVIALNNLTVLPPKAAVRLKNISTVFSMHSRIRKV